MCQAHQISCSQCQVWKAPEGEEGEAEEWKAVFIGGDCLTHTNTLRVFSKWKQILEYIFLLGPTLHFMEKLNYLGTEVVFLCSYNIFLQLSTQSVVPGPAAFASQGVC